MKDIAQLEPNLTRVTLDERKIYLVGTAHVSRQSVELVERAIREFHPDSLAVELCQSRYQALSDPERWKNMDVYQIIRTGKAYVLMAQLVLASFQKRLGDKLDVKPGDEMRKAIDVGHELSIEIVQADREVKTTLKRAWAKASLWSLIKIFSSLVTSLFKPQSINEADIEKLKEVDALESMMAEFSAYLPAVKEVLIDERDRYLAAKIDSAPGKNIVAVIGAGHVPGILRALGTSIDLAELEEIPPPRKSLMVIGWTVPILICALITYGFIGSGVHLGTQMIKAWVLPHGILAALGALIALAHPITIFTAFVVAPFTALNPMIAAGWICGLVEAVLRKPRVVDLQSVPEDIANARGIWRNRVTRVLLVMALANVGSSLGTIVGFSWIAALFNGS